MTTFPRCPLCGATALQVAGSAMRCEWCGLRWSLRWRGGASAPILRSGRIESQFPKEWHVDDYVARGWAAGSGLRYHADVAETRRGHGDEPARGELVPMAVDQARDVTLVVIAHPDDPMLAALVARERGRFAEVVVVQDGKIPRPVEGARTLAHPLEGDFGAQRDRAQDALETPWALHLDTDESLQGPWDHLAALVEVAEREGLDAVAFPRLNVVDGTVSALWPDPQLRLVRASVRYDGRVHERPDAARDWRRTMTVLSGGRHPNRAWAIRHNLARGRVVERTRLYDALGQDRERRADEDALLRPFD